MKNKCSWSFVVAAFIAVAACSDDDDKETGAELGPCYGNNTCNAGLVCASGICVQMADAALPDAGRQDTVGPPDVSPVDAPDKDRAVPDLPAADQGKPDLAPDLSIPDMPPPDLPSPDQLQPDTQAPDLLQPDLVSPDLTPPTPTWKVVYKGFNKYLADIWGSSSTDIYAVGNAGTVIHYDGAQWKTTTIPGVTANLVSVWGTGPADVFVGGVNSIIAHFDGKSWSLMQMPSTPPTGYTTWGVATGFWGTSPTNVYASTTVGVIRYNGSKWSPVSGLPAYGKNGQLGYTLNDIWGSSNTDIYVVGSVPKSVSPWEGIILRYDGSWTDLKVNNADRALQRIIGFTKSDIFTCGYDGRILRKVGGIWVKMFTGITEELFGLWGKSPNDIWAVGTTGSVLHYDGLSWKPVNTGTTSNFFNVWGTANEVYVTGSDLSILRYGP